MTIIQYYRITVFRVEVFPTYHPLFHYFDIHPRPMAIHLDFRVFSQFILSSMAFFSWLILG